MDSEVFDAWICNLISIDKINKLINDNHTISTINKPPLNTSDKIYARCPKSMRIFDKINRISFKRKIIPKIKLLLSKQ